MNRENIEAWRRVWQRTYTPNVMRELDDLCDLALRGLEAGETGAALAGMVLVPREPTEEMRSAAGDIADGFELTGNQVLMIWKDMLAAAIRAKMQEQK